MTPPPIDMYGSTRSFDFLRQMKQQGRVMTMLAVYDAYQAKMVAPHVDIVFLGDSVAMNREGCGSTQGATMEMMIRYGRKVRDGAPHSPFIIDLPEGAYKKKKPRQVLAATRRLLNETGADGVKIEGGKDVAKALRLLHDEEIYVMGHVGTMPSHFAAGEQYRIAGRGQAAADQVIEDARYAIEVGGVGSLVLEMTFLNVAQDIVNHSPVPVIGIGAGLCHGQVLVLDDALGKKPPTLGKAPRFVKNFKEGLPDDISAVMACVHAMRTRAFPAEEHVYRPDPAKDGLVILDGRQWEKKLAF